MARGQGELVWWLFGAGAVGLALWFAEEETGVVSAIAHTGPAGPPRQQLAQELADKWGPIFDAPTEALMVLSKLESSWRPDLVNRTAAALARGGAWGLVQQTLLTAKANVPAIVKGWGDRPEVAATLTRWHGLGEDLLDPDLNMMLAAYQVGRLAREFGPDLKLIAAGYHQGAQKVRDMLAANRPIPDELPPKGKAYVTKAIAAASGGMFA